MYIIILLLDAFVLMVLQQYQTTEMGMNII